MTGFQRALVLGGKTGLVGQALMEVLKDNGWEAEATDRSSVDYTAPDAEERLFALAESVNPSCIFNAIGYTQVDAAEDHPDDADFLNRALPDLVGRVAKRLGCQMVHYSTDFVFNGKKETPWTVDDKPEPLSVYGHSKLAGEEALLSLDIKGLLIIRTAWIFGPGRKNFVRTILEAGKKNDNLNVVNDQHGSPTYTMDLALYTLKLVESGASGIFHITNSGVASWCELASEACRLAQVDCQVNPIPSSAYPTKVTRPAYSVLDLSAFEGATGITPRPWLQGLQDYIFKEFPPSE